MKCFLDMDGVLVDFVNGACKLHSVKNPYETNLKEVQGNWGLEKLSGINPSDFWNPLGFTFWANLEWMHDGRAILECVEERFGKENICLLSSPCLTDGCIDGKMEWIKKNMPEYSRRFLIGPAKHFLAHSDICLIDDRDSNVNDFWMHGGEAILLPRMWNSYWGVSQINTSVETLEVNLNIWIWQNNFITTKRNI